MFLVSDWSCFCTIYWNHMLSGEGRCSWCSADRWCSNYIWVINNLIYQSALYIGDLTLQESVMTKQNTTKLYAYYMGGIWYPMLTHHANLEYIESCGCGCLWPLMAAWTQCPVVAARRKWSLVSLNHQWWDVCNIPRKYRGFCGFRLVWLS